MDRADADGFEPPLEALDMLGTELLRSVDLRCRVLDKGEESLEAVGSCMTVLRTTVGASSRRAEAKASASRRGRR